MKKIFKEFKKLKTDDKRWQWLLKNKDEGYMVILDNDDTMIVFGEDHTRFDHYIGNSEGVSILLDELGINNEEC